ncbi:helix-turn-helix domain-containing protein [Mesobacillus sp. LC4]
MSYQYEQIDYDVDLPIRIFTQTVEQFPYHWHEDTEILFVLQGALEIRVNRDSYKLEAGDLFLINGDELHFVNSTAGTGKTNVLALQIDHSFSKKYGIALEQKRFYLNSNEVETGSLFALDEMKYILANMMDLIINKKELFRLKIEKLLLELVLILLEHFEMTVPEQNEQLDDDQRMLDILKYMNHHCADSNLGLQDIAKEFSLNPQYLSRYFKIKAGVSFKKKLDSMRLFKSLNALRTTDEPVMDIALKYGFPDSKAYYRVFKEVLGITPSKYREDYKVEVEQRFPRDYLSINSRESLANLFKHLERKALSDQRPAPGKSITVDLTQALEEVDHSFTRLTTFGYAPHALRHDFKEQLKMLQDDIKFEYIRFHGILSDELLVYNENPDGTYYFNFNHIDSLLDNLLDSNVKPFIEIGFMPKDLARSADSIFWWKAYVSPPKNMERWLELVDAFIRHLINRFGIQEVRTWYFEFWNEPEVGHFFAGTREEFFSLYAESYRRIKSIDPFLQVGGVGTIALMGYQSWLLEFYEYLQKKNTDLDFITFHAYNLGRIPESQPDSSHSGDVFTKMANRYSIMIGDENTFSTSIDQFIKTIQDLNPDKSKEIWVTEWNANVDTRDLLHDTCYMAAFIVKNAVGNFSKVKGMGYWTFTDIFEERQQEKPLFHGGFGLMTYNGIKRASYNAFYFLNKLGDHLVAKEENMIVTKKGDNYQILLFNYLHPNKLYRTFDYSQLSPTSRYSVFEKNEALSFQLSLEGIIGEYTVKKQYVNRKQGSAYDAWLNMGASVHLDHDAITYIKGKAEPGLQTEEVFLNNRYDLQTILQPHEIQLIELIRRY